MPGHLAIMDAVRSSNIPGHKKSIISRFYESSLGKGSAGLARAKKHIVGGALVFRQGVESAGVGAALGALHVELPTGLDAHIGSSGKSVPIDALVAATGLVSSVFLAHETVGDDLRNVGSGAAAVFAFRKTHDFLAKKAAAKGITPGSVVAATATGTTPGAQAATVAAHGEDAITNLARNMG